MEQGQIAEQLPFWQKQILPHLFLFCLKASHRYDFLHLVQKLKMRITKLGVRESCRSLTLGSHLLSSWTCECWELICGCGYAFPLFSHVLHLFLFLYLFYSIPSLCNGFCSLSLSFSQLAVQTGRCDKFTFLLYSMFILYKNFK